MSVLQEVIRLYFGRSNNSTNKKSLISSILSRVSNPFKGNSEMHTWYRMEENPDGGRVGVRITSSSHRCSMVHLYMTTYYILSEEIHFKDKVTRCSDFIVVSDPRNKFVDQPMKCPTVNRWTFHWLINKFVQWITLIFLAETQHWLPALPCDFKRSYSSGAKIDNRLYLFGGRTLDYHNDFRVFDFTTQTWSSLPETGKKPTRRYGATIVPHGNKIIVFGGYDVLSSFCDDLYEFDTGTRKIRRNVSINQLEICTANFQLDL